MNYRYLLICENYIDDDIIFVSYGIAVSVCYDGCTVILETFNNLCEKYDTVKQLVDLCNKEHLDIVHLPDVINDFMAVN